MRSQGSWTGRLAGASARHRVAVVVALVVLTALLATGLPRLTFEDDPLRAMPRGDPHTQAAEVMVERFPGGAYVTPVIVEVAPEKWAAANARLPYRAEAGPSGDLLAPVLGQAGGTGFADPVPGPDNITDEVYLRAMEELQHYVHARVAGLDYGITLAAGVKMVNHTNTGIPGVRAPDPAAFSMPATDADGARQYQAAWTTYAASLPDAIATITAPDASSTRMAFLFTAPDRPLHAVGQDVADALDAYRDELRRCDADAAACRLQWNVFTPEGVTLDPRGATAAAAHLTRTTSEDLLRLAPIAVLGVGVLLAITFRRIGTVLATTVPMAVAGLGILGTFGWLGLPIHSITLLAFPLLVGNGIDLGIHFSSAYRHARAGMDATAAAAEAGAQAGPPLILATGTTALGMAVLAFAPNEMIAQLGLAIAGGMLLLLLVGMTALPAALSWTRPAPVGGGNGLRRLATSVRRHRGKVAVAVVLLCAVAVLTTPARNTLTLGTPAAYFPEDDPQRQAFEHTNDVYFRDREDLVSNLLVVQGDLATPEAMAMLADLEASLADLDFVRNASITSIRYAMEAWLQVRDGTAGAPVAIAQEQVAPGSTFPSDREGIRELLDEMLESPIATYAAFFIDPDYEVGGVLVEWRQDAAFEELEVDWLRMQRVLDDVQERHPDAVVSIHPAGQTAISYLFTKEELPFVQAAGLLSAALTVAVVAAVRRSWRDAVSVAAVLAVCYALWYAMMGWLAIPHSIALVVPLLLLNTVGSDHVLHLRHGLARHGDAAWGPVGRAVVASVVTDVAAFAVFTQMRYGVLQQATVATVVALAIAGIVSLVVVPALDRPRPRASLTKGADR